MSVGHWISLSFVFVIFIFLPILLPLYLWLVKKNQDSRFYKIGRALRIIMGVLFFLNALFFICFVFAIYLISTQDVSILSVSRELITSVEKFTASGGVLIAIASVILGLLMFKRWGKALS